MASPPPTGRPLCILAPFQPFGLTLEHLPPPHLNSPPPALPNDPHDAYSYALFDPQLSRIPGSDSASCSDHDEELFIHGNSVTWSAGRQVVKRFSAPSAVLQAVWCRFNAITEPLLCILHLDSLATFTPAGEMNIVPLPHAMASIWPLPSGLLLQRAFEGGLFDQFGCAISTDMPKPLNKARNAEGVRDATSVPSTGSKYSSSACTSSGHSNSSAAFCTFSHFTLQHPLEEPQELQYEEAGKRCGMIDVDERILWTSSNVPYVASYHSVKMRHSIWQINLVPQEKESMGCSIEMKGTQSHVLEGCNHSCLHRAWQDEGVQPAADQVFLANDDDGIPVLCFLLKALQRLVAFRLFSSEATGLKVDVAWTIPAIASAPVIATRPWLQDSAQHFDLIILALDGSLSLHTGKYKLCKLYITYEDANDLGSVSGASVRTRIESLKSGSKGQVVGLCDPVQGRVNVITSSGQIYRCSVFPPPVSARTISCINALYEGLPRSSYIHLLSSLLGQSHSSKDNSVHSDVTIGEDSDLEWTYFKDLMMQWCNKGSAVQVDKEVKSPSAWDYLLNSTMHKKYTCIHARLSLPALSHTHFGEGCLECLGQEHTDYSSMLMDVLNILHVLYEDWKLDSLHWRNLQPLSFLLGYTAASLGQWNYLDHYARDFAELLGLFQVAFLQYGAQSLESPFNIFHWLERSLREKDMWTSDSKLPTLYFQKGLKCVNWSRKVIMFYELLAGHEPVAGVLPSGLHVHFASGFFCNSEHRVVLAMVEEGFGLSDLDRLPTGISLPLRHALNSCREAPPSDWPERAYVLIGREDLASMRARKSMNVDMAVMTAPYMLHLRPVPVISSANDSYEGLEVEMIPTEEVVNDGMEHMFNATVQLRFGRDLRLNEVRRLLGSSRPVAVRMANPPDVSDPDIVAQQQAQLWQLAQRTTSLAFGRGAFTIATMRMLLTEALPIPKLVLAGRLPSQHDATVNLDAGTGNLSDLTSWPEFHNGAAAGLRLAPCQDKITRTWIVYNKPDEPSYAHAGLLMSLGLHGHLRVLAATDVYRYLSQEHEATTVGILLGMAAAHQGTMDSAISKMLYLHIPARHPPSFPELELPTLMQSAALMAVGMLYKGSAHRLTTEILLAEIGRKPGGDNVLEREGYALAAGLALGLVTLGKGKSAWGLADLLIEERLLHYMSGGTEPMERRNEKLDGSVGNVFANSSNSYEDFYQNNGQVMEGSMVNLDVTAPGATLALGLMFLKTNNAEVASRLAIPDTHFALEYVRPDFILLRIVAQSMILWESVQASEAWVQAQIPMIVKEALAAPPKEAEGTDSSLGDVDMEAVAQAHVNILAGACLSIGIRFAGTSNSDAQQLLYHYALYFLKEKRSAATLSGTIGPNGRCTYVDRGTLETCLNVAVLSLSVVMAGSGHLGTFKLLRYLRRRNDLDGAINYGNHMAISMAIGFLFLGGGTLTFATNNTAVAALLISLYPRFPIAPNDHRCHLQAFRHLYVLATEARCIQTIDVDTGLPVYVPLEMTLRETQTHSETTFCQVSPCILPEHSLLKRVRVCGPRYWPQDIMLVPCDQCWWEPSDIGNPFLRGVLFVKRKVGARSYVDDPIGCRSLISRTLQKNLQDNSPDVPLKNMALKVDQIVSIFSADPSLLAFAQIFCNSCRSRLGSDFEDFCLHSLLECVSSDKPALLEAYLSFYAAVELLIDSARGHGGTLGSLCSRSLSLCSLKVALAYNEALGAGNLHLQGRPLVQKTFLVALSKRIDDVLSLNFSSCPSVSQNAPNSLLKDVLKYLDVVTSQNDCQLKAMQDPSLLTCYLRWYDIPYYSSLNNAIQQLSSCLPVIDSMNIDSVSNLPVLALLLPRTATRSLMQINQLLCCWSAH